MRATLVVIFIVVPLIELWLLIQVGQVIGAAWTIVALLAVSVAGAWLLRREGTRAWSRFRTALASGRVPTDEVVEGALVLLGGALLLTPGFASDAVGLLLMIPPVRALVASTARRRLAARLMVTTIGGGRPPRRRTRRSDDVVDVEVVNIERSPGDRAPAEHNGDIHSRGSGSA